MDRNEIKDNISANKEIASVKAKPWNGITKYSLANDGFASNATYAREIWLICNYISDSIRKT